MNNKTYKSKKPTKILTAQEFFSQAFEHHTEWMIRVKKPAFPFYMQLYHKSTNGIEVVVVAECEKSPLDYARTIVERYDPDYYIVLSEAWMTSLPSQEDFKKMKENYQYGDIKKRPDKIEVLTVIGKSKDGKDQYSKNVKIVRNKKREIIKFDDIIINGINITNRQTESNKVP